MGKCIDAGYFHGQDGLGDAPDPNAPSLDLVQKEHAVDAIIRIVNENPGQVGGRYSVWFPLSVLFVLLLVLFTILLQHSLFRYLWWPLPR